jgi:hypothetical protein
VTDVIPAELRAELAAPNAIKLVNPRALPARIHHLKAAGASGAHCLYAFQGDGAETLARRLGSGTHAMLLGKPVALWDQPSKASSTRKSKSKAPAKESKAPRSGEAWKAFQAQHAGAVILNLKEMDAAKRMVDAIKSCGTADRLLTAPNAIYERSIIWAQCGRARQSTPDLRRGADGSGPSYNCEIKTARSAHRIAFGRDAKRLAYHAQLADQAAAIAYETGRPPTSSYIIAVESSRPHVVQVYEVPKTILEDGARLCMQWLERLQLYETTDQWGGYSQRIETLEFVEYGATDTPIDFGEEAPTGE